MACAAIPAVYDIVIVLVLFPLEIIFDMMELLTGLMVAPFADCEDDCNSDGLAFDPIGAITEPIQKYILVKNKDGLGLPDYNGTFVNYCRTSLGNDSKFHHFFAQCSFTLIVRSGAHHARNRCKLGEKQFGRSFV